MDQKAFLLRHLYEVIKEIADAEYQESVWVKGLGPECGSFTEAMCGFFDDAQAGYILGRLKEFSLSPQQSKDLEKLFFALSAYSNNTPDLIPDADVIKDPKWLEIQDIAKNTLTAFQRHPLIRDYKRERFAF